MERARLSDSVPASPADALRLAVDLIGSQSATARLLDLTQGAVSKWLANAKPLPAEHVLAVEHATGISRHDLRPDLYPRDGAVPAASQLEPVR